MKLLLPILPLLVQAAPAHNAEKRQIFSLGGNASGPPKVATVLKTLTPEIDSNAKRELKMWGPFKISPSNATHARPGFSNGIKLDPNSDAISAMISPPCSDCSVLKAMANLAYADGKQVSVANGIYTHHIIVVQNGRMQLPNPVVPPCSGAAGLNPFAGGLLNMANGAGGGHAHSKRQEIPAWLAAFIPKMSVFVGGGGQVGSGSAFAVPETVSKVRSGAYISKSDTFQFSSEIVNYDPVEKEIYLTIDFEWVPGKVDQLHDIGMGSVGLDCKADSMSFKPPKDKPITYTGANWTMTHDGYFVNFTPHLHDSGMNVKVFLNEQEICESKAIYGAEDGAVNLKGTGKTWETIVEYTPCNYMKQFKKGDKVRITAE
jgi:hypothetical protein